MENIISNQDKNNKTNSNNSEFISTITTKPSKSKKEKPLDYSNPIQIAFKFMYIGKNYDGLVVQPTTNNTIEEVIFASLRKCKLLPQKDTNTLMQEFNYSRCGRTDKGVNSSGNFFSIKVRNSSNNISKESINYSKLLNNLLPADILILSHKQVDDLFDCRFSCLYREYKYFFLKRNLNIQKMQEAAKLLKGVHDFKRFCKIDKSEENWETKNYTRRIYDIHIEKCTDNLNKSNINDVYYDCYFCVIKGSAFLWHQIRCIMGVLFLVGQGDEEPDIINYMLNMKDNYEFHYAMADDFPLVLSNCVFEFMDFPIEESVSADLIFKFDQIIKENLIGFYVNSMFFNNIFINCFMNNKIIRDSVLKMGGNIDEDNFYLNSNVLFPYIIEKYKNKKKYTKMLNHKTNREKENKDEANNYKKHNK